jgi:hypothetical protein
MVLEIQRDEEFSFSRRTQDANGINMIDNFHHDQNKSKQRSAQNK